jgi:hypothetical protein
VGHSTVIALPFIIDTSLGHGIADTGRVAAVFLPLSPSAAAAVGKKIPHYGKYSYLVFTDGENKNKGTWEPADSPVVHRFKAKELD